MRSLDIGATGMLAQQMNVDVISNNIANMTTTGYKRQRAAFTDLVYQNLDRPGASSSSSGTTLPSGLQIGLGVRAEGVYRVLSQGALEITDNSLDLAISGEGYFQIELPSGETGYTRDGSFQNNENGEIVNISGYILEPGITIPDDATGIDINSEGEVLVTIDGQADSQNIGQIQLARFSNPGGLEAIGENLFVESTASGNPIEGTPDSEGYGSLTQGALEQSNVNVVEDLTLLIEAQRAYEMNSTVISTSDEMLQTMTQLR